MALLDDLLNQARHRRELPDPAIRRLIRERAGLTQSEVAQVLGVDRVTVTRWESGQRTPLRRTGAAYCLLLERLAGEVRA
jgi:transcriptional regulator with XRE-family HTH domain